jgi:hypothetical protein
MLIAPQTTAQAFVIPSTAGFVKGHGFSRAEKAQEMRGFNP